jgi:succinate-semialdehyde dehydrogenase/glutarate-semialdehyde dehydrogenase
MITRKMCPALASGCTFIVKPATKTPYTAIKIMEYCEQAGIPKGVVNLITGSSGEISETFMNDQRVRKVTFTGSTQVGKILIKQSAEQVKKLSLELGGHAPLIILDDADLTKAVKGTMASKFRNGGQTCIAANRIYVQEKVYDAFVETFSEAVSKLNVGNGLEENIDIGPIIDQGGYEKVDRQVKDAVAKGAEIVTGGKEWNDGESFFYQPTVLKNVTSDMLVMNEETFGPIALIQKFASQEEVIKLANDSPFGLAAYLFTDSVTRGTRIVESLDFGIIGWNDGVPSAAQAPFGGVKESGIGREGGTEGIEEYIETKYISLDI